MKNNSLLTIRLGVLASLSAVCLMVVTLGAAPEKPVKPPVAEKPAKWESAMLAFEASDKTNPPPKNAIFFIGSSSFTIWKTMPADLPEFPVVNRGFGGSQLSDSVNYVSRIVLPHKPKTILVYAGDNDIAAGKTATRVFDDFKKFVKTVHDTLPQTKIMFVSIKPSPSRWKFKEQVVTANKLISDYCQSNKNLEYIDIYTPMLDANGNPREELFRPDRLHMLKAGYDIWIPIIKKHLAK